MPCPWNLDTSDTPDPETGQITCRCHECGRYADLDCDRDFETGHLVVQVMTCKAKAGWLPVRDTYEAADTTSVRSEMQQEGG